MEHNRVELTGQVIRIDTVRYSPAGNPLRYLEIEHRSVQPDSGGWREVRFSMMVCLRGDELNRKAAGLQQGERLIVTGALGKAGHRSDKLVLDAHTLERLNQEQ